MALRDVPLPVRPDRDDRWLLKTCRNEDQTCSVDRTRHVRESFRIVDAPDLLAVLRIVRDRAKGPGADDEVAVADANHQRRGIGLRPWLGAKRPPSCLAGPLVDRDHEGFVEA